VNSISPKSKTLVTNVLLTIFGLYLAFALFGTIRRNYELQREIAAVEESNKALAQSNLELQYQIAYFQTELYKDKAARAKLGLQAPGESVLILPKKESSQQGEVATKQKRSNFAQWIDFLRGITQ
jgi:cell division protein FtsB